MMAKRRAEDRPDGAAFEGRLSSISLFDVCQFLMLNRKTGTLTARNSTKAAYLTFHEGQLLNAVDEALKAGEPVILEAVQWSNGTFTFEAGPVPPDRRIQASTETILLEAARQLDEMRAGDLDENGEPTHTETLRKGQEWTEKLGAAFRDAVQSDDERGVTRNWKERVLESLESGSAERALIGPGSRVRLVGAEGIHLMDAPAASEVEAWVQELAPAEEETGTSRSRCVRSHDGAFLWVGRIASPVGTVLAITQPPSVSPSWDELGLGDDLAQALARRDPRPLILSSSNPKTVRWALTGWIARLMSERPLVGWVVEPWPSFAWSALPGRIETLSTDQCAQSGDLARACEVAGAELLVLRGVVDRHLFQEAFALSSASLRVVIVVTAANATDAVQQVGEMFGSGGGSSDFTGRLQGVWSLESTSAQLLPLKSTLTVRREPPR